VLLIGGGVGVTPMMSAVRYLTDIAWPGAVHLILGFRTPADFIFRDEIAALAARNPNLRVTATMSQPDASWNGPKGHIDASVIAAAVPDVGPQRAHICGPPAMMEAVKASLIELGLPESQIRTEAFGTLKRDPTIKAGASRKIAGRAQFQASSTTVPVSAGQTLLDAADAAGIFIDNACRSGTCGSCRVKLISGSVQMPVEDALTGEDRAEGYILACQAEINGNVAVDA
jgi:ferredoxin-NADP reductase